MYYNETTVMYHNGNFVKANEATTSLFTQTLHYGVGVFEGIRSYKTEDGTRIFKAHEHFDRLRFSAEKMHLPFPWSNEELIQATEQLLALNQLEDAYIRPLVYTGENMGLGTNNEVHLAIMAWSWGKYLGDQLLNVTFSPYQRPNPKSVHVEAKVVGHYTNSVLASMEAKQRGFDEALLTDMNGNVAEAPGANFFVEKNGELFTPALGHILAGITRATIIELAQELGVNVHEVEMTPAFVHAADSAFFCGTAAEVVGIAKVDDTTFPLEWEDSLGHLLQKRYRKHVSVNEYKHLLV